MNRMTENKIVIIHRKTRLDELVVKYNTLDQARFYVEHLGADFSDYQLEDRKYKEALATVERKLSGLGLVQPLERSYVPSFVFGPNDIVVVVGQDGLVANTLKYLDAQPVVAVNPDPSRWDGVLLPFKVEDVEKITKDLFNHKRLFQEITLARASLTDGQTMYAVNDLFIGPKTHTSARYILDTGTSREVQSSSGIVVSTGLGSTGWLKSILAGARGVISAARAYGLVGGGPEATAENESGFSWAADYLFFSVREPFPSRTTNAGLIMGRIADEDSLTVTSLMAGGGVIFSDGIESDFLEFNSGQTATIKIADKKGRLVV